MLFFLSLSFSYINVSGVAKQQWERRSKSTRKPSENTLSGEEHSSLHVPLDCHIHPCWLLSSPDSAPQTKHDDGTSGCSCESDFHLAPTSFSSLGSGILILTNIQPQLPSNFGKCWSFANSTLAMKVTLPKNSTLSLINTHTHNLIFPNYSVRHLK